MKKKNAVKKSASKGNEYINSQLSFYGKLATMQAIKSAIASSVKENVGFLPTVSFSEKNDGVKFLNTFTGNRWFISKQKKWQGMIGVSGKVRALLETELSNVNFAWVQQGSKNYYYSKETEAITEFLSRK